jgi:hypothetical protein
MEPWLKTLKKADLGVKNMKEKVKSGVFCHNMVVLALLFAPFYAII